MIKSQYSFQFINCIFFFISSFLIYISNINNLYLNILPPIIFFLGSIFIFIFLYNNILRLSPITFYIIGAAIFYGFGVVYGNIFPHEYTPNTYEANDISYVKYINLLNSISILIIFSCSFFFTKKKFSIDYKKFRFYISTNTIKYFYILFFSSILIIFLKIFLILNINSYLILSFINKLYFIPMVFFFILSFNFYKLKIISKYFGLILLIVYLLFAILLSSKFDLFMFLIPFIAGLMLSSDKLLTNAFCLFLVVITFILFSLIATELRWHYSLAKNIDTNNNPINQSVNIMKIIIDVPVKNLDYRSNYQYFKKNNLNKYKTDNKYFNLLIKLTHNIGYRFDVAFIQRFLIYQYDHSYKGDSLSDFYIFIPRLLWKNKPVVSDEGRHLSKLFYGEVITYLAPTFVGESYWNFGIGGVIILSFLLGLIIAFFNNKYFKFINCRDPNFILIFIPLIYLFLFVESWIFITLLPGIIFLYFIYICSNLIKIRL